MPQGEPERLFQYGYAQALNAWHGLKRVPHFAEGFGPYFGFLADMKDDFFVGEVWMSTATSMAAFLDKEVPVESGVTTEQRMELQSAFALREFEHRNCRLIGN